MNIHQLLSEQDMLSVLALSPNATALYTSENIIIEYANAAMLQTWGKDSSIIGRPMEEAIPELKGQPFIAILKGVWETGITYEASDALAELLVDGKLQTFYFDFTYRAVKNDQGKVYCILHTATDVTSRNVNRQNYERALFHSEQRMKSIVMTASIGLTVLRGPQFIIELANKPMLEIWGRMESEVMGKPLIQVFPELSTQRFPTMLKDVYETGKSLTMSEVEVIVSSDAGDKRYYVDFSYDPLLDSEGEVEAILASVLNITDKVKEQVKARSELQKAGEKLRFAIESANAGTWSIDLRTKDFMPSDRYKELFDFKPEEEMPYEATVSLIQDDYRDIVIKARERAMAENIPYSLEYPINLPDGRVKWLKSYGKVENDSSGNSPLLSGIVLDITEQKMDEIRKNDFIAIVSHELKTPLTSLKGYTQMLNHNARNKGDDFTSNTLSKIENQVNKMNALINGFLNVSRLESGKILLNKQVFDLEKLLADCIQEAKLTTSNHTFSVDAPCAMEVFADQEKMWAVISNLLSNAIKYSPGGCHIEVSCKLENEMLIMSVKDAGMGIKTQDAEKLFERFYRVEGAHSNSITGFGIGLYLSAEIIRCHHGKIWVDSEYGKGSTFHFSIPVS